MQDTEAFHRPSVIVEVWPSNAQVWAKGPMVKQWLRRWDEWGFTSRCKLVRATSVGGAIRQNRLIVARVKHPWADDWEWDRIEPDESVVRPMSNLLTPPGLLNRAGGYTSKVERLDYPDSTIDPMPGSPGAWISTPQGIRRLLSPETARGLGFSKEEATPICGSYIGSYTLGTWGVAWNRT